MVQTTDELRDEIEAHRDRVGRDLEAIGEKVSPGRAVARKRMQVRARVSGWRERFMGTAESTGDAVSDTVHGAGEYVGGTVHGAGERIGELGQTVAQAPQYVAHRTEGSPLMMGMLAFGAGFVVAGLLPSSRTEQELARQVEANLATAGRELVGAGREAAQHLQEPAREAMEQVASTAKEAVQHVGEEAKQVASSPASTAPPSSGSPAPGSPSSSPGTIGR